MKRSLAVAALLGVALPGSVQELRRIAATSGAAELLVTPAAAARGQALPLAKAPEEVGLSSARLARLAAALREGVDKGDIPGAVVVIGRQDRIASLQSFGFRERDTRAPMTPDTIFKPSSTDCRLLDARALWRQPRTSPGLQRHPPHLRTL